MLGALANGTTSITNFLKGADCLSTISCFQKMGIEIEETENEILVHGKGLHGLSAPKEILDAGNSGTTTRLISGILAGQNFSCDLTGDASIQKRPMKRIMTPLSMMGADITSVHNNGCAPLHIKGAPLKGISYQSPVASAQVKSCVLFAGLYADGRGGTYPPLLQHGVLKRGADLNRHRGPGVSAGDPEGVPAQEGRGRQHLCGCVAEMAGPGEPGVPSADPGGAAVYRDLCVPDRGFAGRRPGGGA